MKNISTLGGYLHILSGDPMSSPHIPQEISVLVHTFSPLEFRLFWIFPETTHLLQSGLKVVKVRAEAMQEVSDQVPSRLVSIMGHEDLNIQLLCDNAEEWSYSRGTQEPVACVANYLFPGVWVLGGDNTSVQYVLEYGKAKVRHVPQ